MATGTVKFIETIVEYYGFITDDGTSDDVFVHMDDVDGPALNEGEIVEFDIEDGPKGVHATNVKRLSGAESVMSTGTGTITFFNDEKGYGFITDDGTSDDVFVHMDYVDGPALSEGERVEFEIEGGPKGSRATNVKRL